MHPTTVLSPQCYFMYYWDDTSIFNQASNLHRVLPCSKAGMLSETRQAIDILFPQSFGAGLYTRHRWQEEQ